MDIYVIFVDLMILAGFIVFIVFFINILVPLFLILWDSFLAKFFPGWYFKKDIIVSVAEEPQPEPVQTSEPKNCKKKGKKKHE